MCSCVLVCVLSLSSVSNTDIIVELKRAGTEFLGGHSGHRGLGKNVVCKNPHLDPGKKTFRHSCVCLGVLISVPLCPCNSCQGWIFHVGYTMYPNMLHNNAIQM